MRVSGERSHLDSCDVFWRNGPVKEGVARSLATPVKEIVEQNREDALALFASGHAAILQCTRGRRAHNKAGCSPINISSPHIFRDAFDCSGPWISALLDNLHLVWSARSNSIV